MKTSEKAWELINKYFRYLSSSTESENDGPSSLELISVVRRSDDAVYRMTGITSDTQSGEKIFHFISLNPIVKNYDGIGGSSMGLTIVKSVNLNSMKSFSPMKIGNMDY